MYRWIVIVFLFAASASAQRYRMLVPCRLQGVEREALCGTLAVRENRTKHESPTINLRVVVLPASGKAEGDPMFVLAGGGPGISAVDEAAGVAQAWANVLAVRDVVLVDQRGTGQSNPLDCSLGNGVTAVKGFFAGEIPADIVLACRDTLAKRSDLAAYTTFESAADLDEVRRWLKAKRINLYGASYTSRVAMVYAQTHPSHVRTITMKAPMPFSVRNPLTQPADAQRALDKLFRDSAAAFPTLADDFHAVWERLGTDPPTIDFRGEPLVLTRDVVAGTLRRALMTADGQRTIPATIEAMKRGDFSFAANTAKIAGAIDQFLNLGMFLSVTCTEDVAWYSKEEARDFARDTFSGSRMAETMKDLCNHWPAAALPRDFAKRHVVPVPALIIRGALDPGTSPAAVRDMARAFEHPLVVEVANMAHTGSSSCVASMIATFVDGGDLKKIDTKCARP